MKLYTEEQVLQIIGNLNREYFVTSEELLEEMKLTSIELPSDKEIYERAFQQWGDYSKTSHQNTYSEGATWMRDKIQGNDKQ